MRTLHLLSTFCIFTLVLTATDNPFVGTWKFNPAKSKGTAGTMFKEQTVVFETDGNGVEAVYDGVGASTFEASLASLAVRGTLALFGAASGPVPPFDPQRLNAAGSVFLTIHTTGK